MDEYCGYDTEDVHSGQVMDEVMCEVCGTIQPATNKFCSHCGEEFKKRIKNGGLTDDERKSRNIGLFVALFVAVVVAMVLTSVFHDLIGEDETVKKEEISIEMPEISMPDIKIPENPVNDNENEGIYPMGIYLVGDDIPEGEYFLYSDRIDEEPEEGFCEAYSSLSDDTEEIFGSWFQYSRYAELKEGQTLEISWCNAYDTSLHTIENNPFEHPGMFKVGVDIEAGKYKIRSIGGDLMYFYYVHDSLENFDEDAMYDYFRENYGEKTEVTLEDGQYLEMFNCLLEKYE